MKTKFSKFFYLNNKNNNSFTEEIKNHQKIWILTSVRYTKGTSDDRRENINPKSSLGFTTIKREKIYSKRKLIKHREYRKIESQKEQFSAMKKH